MSVHPTIRHIVAGGLVAAFFALPVHAKYAVPSGASGAKNVAAILETPVDEQYVKLQGHILKKTGHEKYTFSDGTGEIVAEIDDKDFPGQAVDEKTKVEIIGEVDTGRNRAPETGEIGRASCRARGSQYVKYWGVAVSYKEKQK